MPQLPNGLSSLRSWKEVHIDETIDELNGHYEEALFYNCTIKRISDCTFNNCCFAESKFDIRRLDDMQNLTVGLDCNHFSNVELSEKAFDFITLLLIRTKGNTAKRLKLIEALGGKRRVSELLNSEFPISATP